MGSTGTSELAKSSAVVPSGRAAASLAQACEAVSVAEARAADPPSAAAPATKFLRVSSMLVSFRMALRRLGALA